MRTAPPLQDERISGTSQTTASATGSTAGNGEEIERDGGHRSEEEALAGVTATDAVASQPDGNVGKGEVQAQHDSVVCDDFAQHVSSGTDTAGGCPPRPSAAAVGNTFSQRSDTGDATATGESDVFRDTTSSSNHGNTVGDGIEACRPSTHAKVTTPQRGRGVLLGHAEVRPLRPRAISKFAHATRALKI